MPAKVKVRILAGRNLPVMDKSSDASDAFVEIKLGNTTYKTEVYRRSLNPFWNSEWFRFEVSDLELQDEPLQIRVMDYDTYSANDAIGKVYINLNPLIINPSRSMSGWLPIYDTLHGIRGEINCTVKVNLFADSNRYRHSSCGLRFFFSDIPNGYRCDAVLGFVDELLVSDDPEYQWIDKIRTPRASNEARQTLFTKLSGEVQRKLGLKAEIFGGNAVIGYQQSFDLEGGSGIVCRGTGTAVILSKIGLGVQEDSLQVQPNGDLLTEHGRNRELKRMDKHLVHSASVDQFFETKCRVTAPHALDFNPRRLLLRRAESDFENLKDVEVVSTSDDDDDDDEDEDEVTCLQSMPASTLSTGFNSKSIAQLKNTSDSRDAARERRASSNSIIRKLRQSNENLARTLSQATRPITSSIGLTKSFLFRKQSSSRKYLSQSVEIFNYVNVTGVDSTGNKMVAVKSCDRTLIHQESSVSKKDASETSEQVGVKQNFLAPHRQRNEKSQSNSMDDALSIIEERMDDDELVAHKTGVASLGLPSGKAARHISKTKEIELDEESESTLPVANEPPTGSRPNSAVPFYEGTAELRHNSAESRKKLDGSERDLVAKLSNESKCNTSSNTTTATTANDNGHISSSKCEPNQSHQQHQLQADQQQVIQQTSGVEQQQQTTSNLAPQQQLSPHRNRQNSASSANNFIKSVSAVRAQQQLLQNMIKSQNKGLLVSSGLRAAKQALGEPSRVHQREYPFVTLKRFAEGMVQCTGGVVSVHSVKLLDTIISDEESETRDAWWTEIRREIRSHARSLNCNTVLGYRETSKVLDDVCILSAYGTAAVLRPSHLEPQAVDTSVSQRTHFNFQQHLEQPGATSRSHLVSPPRSHSLAPQQDRCTSGPLMSSSPPKHATPSPVPSTASTSLNNKASPNHCVASSGGRKSSMGEHAEAEVDEEQAVAVQEKEGEGRVDGKGVGEEEGQVIDCSFCHTPLTCAETLRSMADCNICGSHKVASILLMTLEPPANLHVVGTGSLVQARVCRPKRDSHGEAAAKEIGDALPFLEYELHRQLFVKLKFRGMNCLFNLTVDISVGEHMLTAVATGTGCFILALPMPEAPRIQAASTGSGRSSPRVEELQRMLEAGAQRSRDRLDWAQINEHLAECRKRFRLLHSQQQEQALLSEERNHLTECGEEPADESSVVGPTSPPTELSLRAASYADQQHHHRHHHRKHRRHHHHQHHHHHHHYHKHQNHHNQTRHSEKRITGGGGGNGGAQGEMLGDNSNETLFRDNNNILLEVDDNEDAHIVALLAESYQPPGGYLVCNSESVPGLNQASITSINMFTQVMRAKIGSLDQFARQFDWCLQALYVKLRRSLPCCLSNVRFVVDLPESSVVQLTVTGCLLSLSGDKTRASAQTNGQLSRAASLSLTSMSSSSSSSSISDTSLSRSSSTRGSQSLAKPSLEEASNATTGSQVTSTESTETLKGVTALTPKPSSSKTNLAAFFAMGGGGADKKNKSRTSDQAFELTSGGSATRRRDDKVEQKDKLEGGAMSLFRPVFKKQQTYPGANSPQISGQDRLLPSAGASSMSNGAASGAAAAASTGVAAAAAAAAANTNQTPSAASRATSILNKVKQPLRELAANTSSSSVVGASKLSGASNNTGCSLGILQVSEANAQLVASSAGGGASRKMNTSIDITSLSQVPGARQYLYLGNLSFSFVRETSSVRDSGGLNGFLHCFLMEVYAIVRAHVSALRGNAFLSFRLQQSCILDHSNKNQAQCLVSVAGDAAQVTF